MENTQKKRVLEMIKDGKISVDEGFELLNAINDDKQTEPAASEKAKPSSLKGRKLRIQVVASAEEEISTANVNVAIPMNVVKAFLPIMKSGIIPEAARIEMNDKGIEIDSVVAAIEEIVENIDELDEDIVNIEAGDPGEKATVKIYVE